MTRQATSDTSSDVVVNVVNDAIAPTVSVSGPVAGSTVRGTVPVAVTAIDNIGVTKVELYANGSLIFAGNRPRPATTGIPTRWPTAPITFQHRPTTRQATSGSPPVFASTC